GQYPRAFEIELVIPTCCYVGETSSVHHHRDRPCNRFVQRCPQTERPSDAADPVLPACPPGVSGDVIDRAAQPLFELRQFCPTVSDVSAKAERARIGVHRSTDQPGHRQGCRTSTCKEQHHDPPLRTWRACASA